MQIRGQNVKKNSKNELLCSAFCEFAKNGFEGATTRDIANRAGINISSILYYFGGKKGIYAAALHNIVAAVKQETDELAREYSVVVKKKDSAEARKMLKKFTEAFLTLLCGEKLSKDMKTVFLSEYSKPTEDFQILYEGLILPFYKKMVKLLELSSRGRITLKDAYLYMFPFFAQMFVFSSRKDTICKFMDWKTYGEQQKQKLLDYMYNQIDFLIDSHK